MGGSKKGFTLIEILITIVVTGAIFAGVMPLIFKTITTNRTSKLKLTAYEAAHQELESMRGQAVSTMTNHSFAVGDIPGANGYIIVDRAVDGEEQTDIAAVTSQVVWYFNGKYENVQLKTFLYGAE